MELQLHEFATPDQRDELAVFVRFCVDRIEREVGRASRWRVTIVPSAGSCRCDVTVVHDDGVIEAEGRGCDGAVAGCEAFCRIRALLRDRECTSEVARGTC